MRQASFKIKSYIGSVDVINHSDFSKLVLKIILFSFGILALCYVFLLGNMVLNIVERKALETNARTLLSEVGELELTYLNISDTIDLDLAHSMGFKEVETKFTTRKSLGNIGIAKNEL